MAAAPADNTSTATAPDEGGGGDDETILVRTTLPILPLPTNDARPRLETARLLVRPLQQSDLAGLHALRTQPEAMTGTRLGRPDRDLAETQGALDFFLGHGDSEPSYLWGAFLRSTGELIGEGGVHALASDAAAASGWPEIGYKFRREHWGQGYATELLGAVLGAWWKLPRRSVEIRANKRAVVTWAAGDDDGSSVAVAREEASAVEHVYANAEPGNVGSCRVLEKLGFQRFHEWTEPDTQGHRIGQPLDLAGYLLASPDPTELRV
ncbi:GNAT domain-containing protein [Apiospora saccharicola]|uniref:GNAT domain-containing protein n=1 Tax=Apiospora saccharicola TaxID=335842 RepID=A0ABR1WGJ4_9PEZI